MTNVIEHQTTIWKRLKENVDAVEHHLQQARSMWPDIAKDMVELRDQYSDDISFGKALVEHGIEFNAHNRAAYIWMGRLTREQLEDAMDNCARTSPRHFRKAVEGWNDPYYAPKVGIASGDTDPVVPEPTPEPVQEHEIVENPVAENTNSKTAEVPAIETILNFYTSDKLNPGAIKSAIYNKHRKKLADLILSGAFGESNAVASMKSFTPKCLFYGYPDRWNPYKTHRRKYIVLENMDKFVKHIELCNGDFSRENCNIVWHEMNKPKTPAGDVPEHAKTLDLSGFDSKPEVTYQERPDHEDKIIAHGQRIWPTEFASYSYEEAWAAYEFWKAIDGMMKLGTPSAASRGRHYMSQAAYLAYGSPGFEKAFHKIATAQHYNPDNTECYAVKAKPRIS